MGTIAPGTSLGDLGAGRLSMSRSDGGAMSPMIQAPIMQINASRAGAASQAMSQAVDPSFVAGAMPEGSIMDTSLDSDMILGS